MNGRRLVDEITRLASEPGALERLGAGGANVREAGCGGSSGRNSGRGVAMKIYFANCIDTRPELRNNTS